MCRRSSSPQPSPAHALGDQRALVFGHGAADLEQQLVVRIPAHRPVEELDFGPVPLQLLHKQNLMDVVAGQAIGRGDQDAIDPSAGDGIAQPVETRALQDSAAIAVIAKDVLGGEIPVLGENIGPQPLELLLSRLALGLALGRNTNVDGNHRHGGSPRADASDRRRRGPRLLVVQPRRGAADRLCPSACARSDG